MRRHVRRVLASMFLALTPTAVSAQQPHASTPVESPQLKLYLIEFKEGEALSGYPDLGRFITSFLELRLNELNSVDIVRRPALPDCGAAPSPGNQPSTQFGADTAESPVNFYIIWGSIEVHPERENSPPTQGPSHAGREFVLNYELTRVVNCQPHSVLRRFENFTESDLLDSLTLAGSLLAVRLRDELPRPVRIDVLAAASTSAETKETPFADGLIDAIIARLEHTSKFEVHDLRKEKLDTPRTTLLKRRSVHLGQSIRCEDLLLELKCRSLCSSVRARVLGALVDMNCPLPP